MTTTQDGLHLLAGPQQPYAEAPTAAELARLFDILVNQYRYVVVDCSGRLDQTTRLLSDLSNAVLMVVQTDVVSLWSAGRIRGFLEEGASRNRMHVATLASANPVDVISTDRHTVKPWFQGRIPFSFNLPELANTEFTLAGGKVSYLKGTPGAQLVYEYGKHHISVFIYPERTLQLPLQSDGLQTDMAFHTMTWTEGNLRFFVVGDVSADQVRSLGTLLQAANRS